MPPYDPKANRPKLVPVDDDAAPVDAILGPAPTAERTADRTADATADTTTDKPVPVLASVPLPADAEPDRVAEPEVPDSISEPTVDTARPRLSVVPPEPTPRSLSAVPSTDGTGGGSGVKKVLAVVVAVVAVIGTIAVLRRRH